MAHGRQNMTSFAESIIVKRLAEAALCESTSILFPSTYALRGFRERLQKRLPTIGGVRMHTPSSLRRELLAALDPDLRPLPAESLIPWQIENGFSPDVIHEIQWLHPAARNLLCPNSLWERAESEKLFTPAALDMQLCATGRHVIWDRFFSIGFPECSWENYHLLRAVSNCATSIEHFFELTSESHSVDRWRKLWKYLPDDNMTEKNFGRVEVFTVDNVTDFTFVILGKIASILASHNSVRGCESPRIAVGFSRCSAHYHALRQRLENARIPFLDLFARGKVSDWSPLWPRWMEYQRCQRRNECLALIDCKFTLGLMEAEEWEKLQQRVWDYSRRNVTGNCGQMLPKDVREWIQPLPARGKIEEFWQNAVGAFPQLRHLTSGVKILSDLYETVTREEFLCWLEATAENQFRKLPQKDWSANVHVISYEDLPACDCDYVICGDWEARELNYYSELLGGMPLESINELLADFHYDFSTHVPSLEMVVRGTVAYAKEVTVVAIKEFGTENPNVPIFTLSDDFSDPNETCKREQYLRGLGNFFDSNNGQMKEIEQELRAEDIAGCVHAHRQRRNTTMPFGIYDFGAGGDEKWRDELLHSIPCKAWELAFEHPEEIWMQQILRIKTPGKSIFDEIPMILGTGVHAELAKKFAQITPNRIEHLPFVNLKKNHITHSILYQMFGIVRVLERQASIELADFDSNSTKSEQNISSFIANGNARIWTRGRVDLVASGDANYLVIDFKTQPTGTAFTAAQIFRGKFLQVILYGLYYQCAGRTVVMRILSPHQRAKSFDFSKLKPEEVVKMDIFISNFEKLQRSLTFGYGNCDRFLAYAHSPLPANIVNTRRALSGLGEVAGEDF
ncbi:MAG: hypothetical protein LBI34_03150 [Puniceicoccales bacterium]|nr:hypothetical protein [Puniceicoccales bacterium]